jgi:hypothetical protein
MDVLFRIGHLQEQKLRDDDVRDHVIHRRAEEKNAVNEQARINIPTALAATGLFNHNWNQKIFHGSITTPFLPQVKTGNVFGLRRQAERDAAFAEGKIPQSPVFKALSPLRSASAVQNVRLCGDRIYCEQA